MVAVEGDRRLGEMGLHPGDVGRGHIATDVGDLGRGAPVGGEVPGEGRDGLGLLALGDEDDPRLVQRATAWSTECRRTRQTLSGCTRASAATPLTGT